MTITVAILAALLAVALLFIVALLRSHAEILRRLAALEAGFDAGVTSPPPAARPSPGGVAAGISGQTLAGDPAEEAFGADLPPTLLAFMGSSCQACAPLWDELHGDPVPTPAGARLLIVTKGPERERLARLLELAPSGANVVMSTQAWSDYSVPGSPHFVLVRGGEIAGRGSATSWAQITAFLTDADDDDRIHRARAWGREASGREASGGGALGGGASDTRALGTEARAARAERALAQAGITPEHPSLYPSREAARDK